MPQLDKLTIVTQIFWLVVVLSGLYLTLLCYVLPKLGLILKLRSKISDEILCGIRGDIIYSICYAERFGYAVDLVSMETHRAMINLDNEINFFWDLLELSTRRSKRMKRVTGRFSDELVSTHLKCALFKMKGVCYGDTFRDLLMVSLF